MKRFFNLVRFSAVLCATVFIFMTHGPAFAGTLGKLKVGVYESAPFAFKNELGRWHGIAVNLWIAIAKNNGWDFDFVEVAKKDAVARLAAGNLDVIAAGLPVTAKDELLIDFSQPFYAADWSIAIMRKPIPTVGGALARVFFSWQFWAFVGGLVLSFILIAVIMWRVEVADNPEYSGPHPAHGIAYGLYWAVAMMTRAGEKSPKSFWGRIIAITWLATAFFVSGAFTASVTTVLSVEHLGRKISSERDLPKAYVAAVQGGCEPLLDQMNVRYERCASEKDCLQVLEKGKVDAVVAGEPFIKYYAAKDYKGRLDIIPMDFDEVFYAIGLKPKSEIAEQVNRGVLSITSSYAWAEILRRYLKD
jgi:ABC-type amino acid transport substrate-binding protein